jgi:uncharacterized Zn finger protein (UPF0148 family)
MNAYYLCDTCGPRIFNRMGDDICKTCGSRMDWENEEYDLLRNTTTQHEHETHDDEQEAHTNENDPNQLD